MIVAAEQLEKLIKLKLTKKQDPEYLESKIASLKTSYWCQKTEDCSYCEVESSIQQTLVAKQRQSKWLVVTLRVQTSLRQ
jgi:hypothetical protein